MDLTVIVAGAGLGGLSLAHGLRAAGVPVRVLERDATAATRGQGYRLRIDHHGVDALRRCLPGELMELFHATANPPSPPRGLVFDHRLVQTAALGESLPAGDRRPSLVADRATLRQILLAGLDHVVEFGAEVVSVRDLGSAAVVELADGRSLAADLVVGADGAGSAVRRALLPHAGLHDTGLRGIYGRAGIAELTRLPEALLTGSPRVVGPGGISMTIGSFRPVHPPGAAAARLAPYARLADVAPYLKWSLIGLAPVFGLSDDPATGPAGHGTPEQLHATAARLTGDWHPALAEVVRRTEPRSVFAVPLRASISVEPWPAGRITLLGDAIHATTPAGGTGANLAMRDAALLARRLDEVRAGRLTLLEAVAGYEEQMREYGFAGAARSVAAAQYIFGSPVAA